MSNRKFKNKDFVICIAVSKKQMQKQPSDMFSRDDDIDFNIKGSLISASTMGLYQEESELKEKAFKHKEYLEEMEE